MTFIALVGWNLICPIPVSGQLPVVSLNPEGVVELSSLPPLLNQGPIRRQLTSGLTTTFSFRLRADTNKEPLGGANISVRYDLWEEVFLIQIVAGDGSSSSTKEKASQLDTWWRNLLVPLLPTSDRSSEGNQIRVPGMIPRSLKLRLTVLPFSTGELADTKRWLSRADSARRSGSRLRPAAEPSDASGASPQLFDLLLGSSLERKALLTQRWAVTLQIQRPKP